MRGRPTKFRPEMAQRIIDLVRVGNSVDASAETCGFHRATVYRWLQRGKGQASGPLREFHDEVMKAQGECETRLVTLIAKAAWQGDVRAAMWLLERRNPRFWGPRIQVTVREEFESFLSSVEAMDPDLHHQLMSLFSDELLPQRAVPSGIVVLPPEDAK